MGIPFVCTRHIVQYDVQLAEVQQGSVAAVGSDMLQSTAQCTVAYLHIYVLC